jgi:predicted dehydrogenase
VRGPNDEIRAAVIGLHGQGRSHVESLRRLPNVRVVVLCDVDSAVLGAEQEKFAKRGESVDTVIDVRRLLDRRDIDVVSIATPNHWHALMAIWACQAGKDVYVEKPVSHNVWEGRQIVNAAAKYGRIVQAGTQSRSSQGIAESIAWLREGNLGAIRVARGLCYKPRASIGKVETDQTPPTTVDYDLWIGPAPMKPLHRKSLHYDWHWVFDTGNGDLGNQGIHQMDIARWVLGEDAVSPRVMSVGGRFGYADDGDTPNTQFVFHDYPSAPLVFEVRGLPSSKAAQEGGWNSAKMDKIDGVSVGVVIECEGGHLVVPDYSQATALDRDGKTMKTWKGATDHFANFIDSVRSRRTEDLAGKIEDGHVSSALCHTGNISYRLGARRGADEVREEIRGNAAATATFERMAAHLAANGVETGATPAVLGPWLEMNPESERFVRDEAANAMLTRDYRSPFVVPNRV